MKIMQILTDTNVGGAGIWLLNFLRSYNRELIEMVVLLPKHAQLKPMVEQLGCRVIEVPKIEDKSFSVEGIGIFKKIIEQENPDIIHTHACLSARIAGRMCHVKIVNTRHCIEEAKRFPVSIVYKMLNNSLSDIVVAVSEAVFENLIQDGMKPEKVRVVYNGIKPLTVIAPEQKQVLRRRYGIQAQDVVIGIVARLEPVKNHALFLEAAKFVSVVHPHVKFLVVGTGSLDRELRKIADSTPELSNRVIFTGYIENVNDIANIIDIHVSTSVREALSIALIEGMSLGKPCITTDSGGTKEVVEHGKNGIVVPNNDAVNLSLAMIDLAQNEDRRSQYGNYGKTFARKRFDLNDMAKKIECVYTELMEEGEKSHENA